MKPEYQITVDTNKQQDVNMVEGRERGDFEDKIKEDV